MKFALLVAAVAAQTPDWTPCTKQDCASAGWICCDTTEASGDTATSTGTMICTDPNARGTVPATGGDFAGNTYHCTADQHKDYIDTTGGADGAKTLAASMLATAASVYMLA